MTAPSPLAIRLQHVLQVQGAPSQPATSSTVPSGLDQGPRSPGGALTLQRRVGDAVAARPVEDARTHGVREVLRSPGQGLDPQARTEMEQRFDADFSDVRIHTGSAAHASAQAVGATAYTSGSHVVFQRGQYDASSPAGRRTLAHELTHVIQQRSGMVLGSAGSDGLAISDPSDRFEREAEANAVRALSGPAPSSAAPTEAQTESVQRTAGPGTVGEVIQRDLAPQWTGTPYVNYGPLIHGSASKMTAELHGGALGTGSAPKVRPPWWPKPGTTAAAWFSSFMVQGHLLNEHLGGPGNTMQNLTPLTKSGNSMHHTKAEGDLKNDVLQSGMNVTYSVVPHYDGVDGAKLVGSGGTPAVISEIDRKYADKIAKWVEADYTVWDAAGNEMFGGGWVVHNEKDF